MRIGVVGKYVSLPDAYLSVAEALRHGGFHNSVNVEIEWIQAEEVEGMLADGRLHDLDGIVIPGGFGERGIEGKIAAAGYAREHEIPCLGLCLGLQMMVIEFARNVLGLDGRQLHRVRPHHAAPGDRPDGHPARGRRHGRHHAARHLPGASCGPGRSSPRPTARELVYERHRHRYEFNNKYRARFEEAGLICSGVSPDDRLVEFVELEGHPFWVGTQAHPELKSRPDRPAPLFREFVAARQGAVRGPPAAAARSRRAARRRALELAVSQGRGAPPVRRRTSCTSRWRRSRADDGRRSSARSSATAARSASSR